MRAMEPDVSEIHGLDEAEQAGYRLTPRGGPSIRTDVIDVYIFRRTAQSAGDHNEIELLQLLRAGAPMDRTWQPVMGHAEPGERAWEAGLREVEEEVGLARTDPALLGMWALEQIWPYYLADLDCIVMSPRFAIEVAREWEPRINGEHSDSRWISAPHHGGQPAAEFFMWPGQKHAIRELMEEIVCTTSPAHDALRIALDRG